VAGIAKGIATTAKGSLRVLLVEADEKCATRVRDVVAQMPVRVEIDWERSFEAGFVRINSNRYDALLVGGRLGDRSGLELLRALRGAAGDAPVLLLSDGGDRALDLSAMESGAAGFLSMDLLDADLLERSIRYAVEARRQEAVLRRTREELQERVESAHGLRRTPRRGEVAERCRPSRFATSTGGRTSSSPPSRTSCGTPWRRSGTQPRSSRVSGTETRTAAARRRRGR
jgi:DNA-binding NarL/FixJ family response regulator